MDEFLELGRVDDIVDGEFKKLFLEGKELLLAQLGDNYYCVDNRCPHMGGDLSQGELEGSIITCPVHHSQFDLKDGKIIRWTDWSGLKLALSKIFRAPRNLTTYELKVEGDKILVKI